MTIRHRTVECSLACNDLIKLRTFHLDSSGMLWRDSRLPHLNESLEAGSRHHIFQRRATRPWEDTVAKFCPKHIWAVTLQHGMWNTSGKPPSTKGTKTLKNLFKPFQAVCQSTKKSGQHTPVWVTLRQFGQTCRTHMPSIWNRSWMMQAILWSDQQSWDIPEPGSIVCPEILNLVFTS